MGSVLALRQLCVWKQGWQEDRERTSALRLAYTCPHLSGANHSEALGLVERAHFLLSFAERHAILQLAELGLRICFLRFAGSRSRNN